jgi:quinolinate synthase
VFAIQAYIMTSDTILETATSKLQHEGFLKLPVAKGLDLVGEIHRLKKEKNAVILAHYYQRPEIQDIADYVGDSLGLSQQAAQTKADLIVFAGVHFMGETAKILNPKKKVVLPDLKAGCSLAESAPPDLFKSFLQKHPNHIVITYINCTAEIKAMSDIICTSANAEKIVNSIPKDQPIIFAPDKNLGNYLIHKTGRDMVLWEGACIVHHRPSGIGNPYFESCPLHRFYHGHDQLCEER